MNDQPRDLQDQIALVTGSAQGLGLAIAHTLARRGAHVVLGDVQQDVAAKSAVQWQAEGLKAEALPLDIGDTASVDRCFEQIVARHGRLAVVGYVDGVHKAELDLSAVHVNRFEIFGVSNAKLTAEERAAATRGFVRDVVPALADGRIVPVVDSVFTFDELPAAKARMEANQMVGKIVVNGM